MAFSFAKRANRPKQRTSVTDPEFGEILVTRVSTRYLRLRVQPDGSITATIPYYATLLSLKALINKNRAGLRKQISKMPKNKALSEEEKKELRKKARKYLTVRLAELAHQGDFYYSKIRISSARTRWGSCSMQGTISLNIALMTIPKHLSDYVILHELAHTDYMSHSPEFWNRVAQVCPRYKQCRKELKDYSPFI